MKFFSKKRIWITIPYLVVVVLAAIGISYLAYHKYLEKVRAEKQFEEFRDRIFKSAAEWTKAEVSKVPFTKLPQRINKARVERDWELAIHEESRNLQPQLEIGNEVVLKISREITNTWLEAMYVEIFVKHISKIFDNWIDEKIAETQEYASPFVKHGSPFINDLEKNIDVTKNNFLNKILYEQQIFKQNIEYKLSLYISEERIKKIVDATVTKAIVRIKNPNSLLDFFTDLSDMPYTTYSIKILPASTVFTSVEENDSAESATSPNTSAIANATITAIVTAVISGIVGIFTPVLSFYLKKRLALQSKKKKLNTK